MASDGLLSAHDDALESALAASCLAGLPADAIESLVAGARRVHIDAGTSVHDGTRVPPHFELVISGLVRVHISDASGRSLTVRYCRSGALVGAATIFAAATRPFAIQALAPSELLRCRPEIVREVAERDIRVARALLGETSERVLMFVGELSESAFATVRERVARHLLDLAAVGQHGSELVAEVSGQQLADSVGSVREVVVRTLRELRDEGVVATGKDGIHILDPERLVDSMLPADRATGT